MRGFTHILYKIIREVTWADLCLDCIPGDAEEYTENHTSVKDMAKRGLSNVGAMFGDGLRAVKDPKAALEYAKGAADKAVRFLNHSITLLRYFVPMYPVHYPSLLPAAQIML